MTSRFNLVLLTIAAWRPDFVDEFEGVPLTPCLQPYAGRTVRFANAYANAPWTSPALLSVFTGRSSAHHGVHFEWSTPDPGTAALAANLRAAGWQTPNLSYLNRLDNYANLGYQQHAAPEPPTGPEDSVLLDAIAATPEPFFLWFHYKFVHLPYTASAAHQHAVGLQNVPDRLRDSIGSQFVVPRHQFRLDPADRDLVRRMYASGVLRMNDWLMTILDALQTRDVMARTSLVLTSDHGEELLEHGHVGHASTAHHATLHEEVLRIPLMVIDPRIQAPRTLRRRVQGLDLYPTLHGLAGHPVNDGPGVDLGPAIFGHGEPDVTDDRWFYFRSAAKGCPTLPAEADQFIAGLSDGRRKYVVERYDVPAEYSFDLLADPGEQVRQPLPDGPLADRLRAERR